MWSKKEKKCIECGTRKRKHAGQGKCTTCYSRDLYKRSPNRRVTAKKAAYRWMKNNPERWKEIQAKAVKKYLKKKKYERQT